MCKNEKILIELKRQIFKMLKIFPQGSPRRELAEQMSEMLLQAEVMISESDLVGGESRKERRL